MSTRKLIIAALATGLVILIAGAVFLVQVGIQAPPDRVPPTLPPGATSTTVG